jgi:hypothetical protein
MLVPLNYRKKHISTSKMQGRTRLGKTAVPRYCKKPVKSGENKSGKLLWSKGT